MENTVPHRPAPGTRVHASPDELVPRILVRCMLALVLSVLALVSVAVLSGKPLESVPPQTPVISEKLIWLEADSISGAAIVRDAEGTIIADFPKDKGGFVAGINRVLIHERKKRGLPQGTPVLLQLREGKRLSVTDPATGWSADLMGFGADNIRTFARLLDQP